MAHSQLHCSYKALATGVTPAALASLLAAVPLDLTLPRILGLIPVSDSTTSDATSATRTIVLGMGAATYGTTAGINFSFGSPRGPIQSATVQAGVPTNYPCPPLLSFGDPTGSGAGGFVEMGLGAAIILNGGGSYTGATVATLVGGDLRPGGIPAAVTPVIVAGVITGVTITTVGEGYTTFPQVVFTDTGGGSGAIAVMSLTPVEYEIQQQGQGYSSPTLDLTPRFQASCPDTADQKANVKGWMTTQLAEGALTVVQELAVTIT